MSSTGVGTLFLDENMEVRKFTPEIRRIFMILDSDIGRPINHIAHRLVDVDLQDLIKQVSETNHEFKLEVRSSEGAWFLLRLVPYNIGRGVVSGLVLTLVDISPLKAMQAALTTSEDQANASDARYALLFNTMIEGVVFHNAAGEITSANKSAQRILGLTFDQMIGRTSIDPRWRSVREDGSPFPGSEHPAMMALSTGKPVLGEVMGVYNPEIDQLRWIRVNAVPLFQPGQDRPYEVYATFTEITDAHRLTHTLEADSGNQQSAQE